MVTGTTSTTHSTSALHHHGEGYELRVDETLVTRVQNFAKDCFEGIRAIPGAVKDFLVHRYADVRMFMRAFSSMGSGTTSRDIDRRITELNQLKTHLLGIDENQFNDRLGFQQRFSRLPQRTKDLLFYTTHFYVQEFLVEGSEEKRLKMVCEMLRECNQAISFQERLGTVNTFYRAFTGNFFETSSGVTSAQSHVNHPFRNNRNDFNWAEGLFGNDGVGGLLNRFGGLEEVNNRGRRGEAGGVSVPTGGTVDGIDLDIPGTVAYVQNQVPREVQQKADEITALKARFETLTSPPDIPEHFSDFMDDIMLVPVFDASHPTLQQHLPALRSALSQAGGGTTAVNEHRNQRHIMDATSLEGHLRAGNSWAPAKCPNCRHPQDGGINRRYLRIDTALQDDILAFLRQHAPAAGAGTTTVVR